jgi:hypothetical protein
MYKILENGCEIVRSQGVEVGIMQTEIPGKPEAWLWWVEGQSLVSDRGWFYGTKKQTIGRINSYLENIGLKLENNSLVLKEG